MSVLRRRGEYVAMSSVGPRGSALPRRVSQCIVPRSGAPTTGSRCTNREGGMSASSHSQSLGSPAPSRLAAALEGRYVLERELGRGGMATVHLARDVRHRRPVALKVLHADVGALLGPSR